MKKLIIYSLIGVVLWYIVFRNTILVERFESRVSCLQQGYPEPFCQRVPIQSKISDSCYCDNRILGTKGRDGMCNCNTFHVGTPYYVDKTFHDYLNP